MLFFMRVDAPGVETDFGQYALVNLATAYIQLLAKRRNLWTWVRGQDMDVRELVFADPSVAYFDNIPEGLLPEEAWLVLEKEGVVSLPNETSWPQDEQTPTELEQLVVREDGIQWSATLKHLEVNVWTREIKYEKLLPRENV